MADLVGTVGKGDLRESLEALRDALAEEIEAGVACVKCGGTVSSPTAALAKQLRDLLVQLDGMRAPEGSKTSDLKANRARRQARVAQRATRGANQRSGGDRASG